MKIKNYMSKETFKIIEDESDDLIDDLNQPFNPKDIDITVETRSLDSIISRIKHSEIDLNTHFQRKGDLWANTIMSRLIESILIRFPLPAFYFDATNDDKWLVVDGLQRLSAIKRFVLNCDPAYVNSSYTQEDILQGFDKPLKLVGLEYLKECNGMTYDNLSATMKRRINEAQITTYLVKPGTPEEVVYSIFYRINTGGLMLNAQEIRHALNQNGKAPAYVEKLADFPIFKKVIKISDKRMQDRELVLRHLAFRMHNYQEYKPSMVRFLNRVMKELNSMDDDDLDSFKNGLVRSLQISSEIFGEEIFSKSVAFKDYKNSLNRALFEAWTVNLAELPENEVQKVLLNKATVLNKFRDLLKDNSEFERSISISTTGSPQVSLRFKLIRQIINSVL